MIESTALKRVIVRQCGNDDLWLCGQACVAMLANVSLQEAIIACNQLGATSTNDLMNGLWVFQIDTRWQMFSPRKLRDICIIRCVTGDKSHWTVKAGDLEYNPSLTEARAFDVANLKSPRTTIDIQPKTDEPRAG